MEILHIDVNPEIQTNFDMLIRIPGWAREEPVPGDLYHYKNKLDLPVSIKSKRNRTKNYFTKRLRSNPQEMGKRR